MSATIRLASMTMIHGGAWAADMRAQGLSTRTIDERTRIIRRVTSATGQAADAFTREALVSYLGAEEFSPNTRQSYWSALRAWHQWLLVTGRRTDDPTATMKKPKTPRGVPHPVSPEDLARLLTVDMWPSTRAMILLAAYAGLRVHEIAKIRGEDIHGDEIRVQGKGDRVDYLPLHPVLQDLARDMPRHGWWFPSPAHSTHHIDRASVSASISRAMRRAGVKGSAHWLRHFYGTQLLRTGTDIRTVQELMRHASLQTTARYTEVTDERRRAAVARLVA